MRRVLLLLGVLFSLVLPPSVAAASPRESFDRAGFDAFASECTRSSCTDTFVFAEIQVTDSGEVFTFACVDQHTFRRGRESFAFGCEDDVKVTVADDLSSATLSPTAFTICGGGHCSRVTISATMTAVAEESTFTSRFTERDANCTFSYSERGQRRRAEGTITIDGDALQAQGSISSSRVTLSERCR
jgi:hypothetical protein